jgi:hypothetical protein
MSNLPQFVRRLPYVFYCLAIVFFAWNLGNQWVSLSQTYQYADPDGDAMGSLAKSMALLSAVSEAAYMIANGAIIHVLLAVHDRLATK